MALGAFSFENQAEAAEISNGPTGRWSTSLPLANLKDHSRYTSRPARQLWPADLPRCQFEWLAYPPRPLTTVALFFHTLSLGAKYRLRLRLPGGSFDEPAYDTGWLQVAPRLRDSVDIDWLDPTWWLGHDDPWALRRSPHLFIQVPVAAYAGGRFEFDDRHNPDGCFDIGGLWLSEGFTPEMNFERGRELSAPSRNLHSETPSGRLVTEHRTSRRELSLAWSALTTDEMRRVFDAALRLSTGRTVLFLPDADDPQTLVREAFPATFAQPPKAKFIYDHVNPTAAVFREILA